MALRAPSLALAGLLSALASIYSMHLDAKRYQNEGKASESKVRGWMPGITILGSGRYVPGNPVKNAALSRVMDTSEAWILKRTGIEQRYFAGPGVGVSDLAVVAAHRALESANLRASDIDYILFNTMTPEYPLPGSGALFGEKLGIVGVPALDLRQQCAAIPFSLQVADGLVSTGAARRVLLVGAETHAGFMPWQSWNVLESDEATRAPDEEFQRATQHRGVSILFGDGAGAWVLGAAEGESAGFLGAVVHTDGSQHDTFRIDSGGFRRRVGPDALAFDPCANVPSMNGRQLFRTAVEKLPEVIQEVCTRYGVPLDSIDWFIAHQANDRINKAVKQSLGVPEHKLPSNIARYGNTSSATIPILLDELLREGQVKPGHLICFLALGAGLNWGAALLRL